jgi:hypothetical protein
MKHYRVTRMADLRLLLINIYCSIVITQAHISIHKIG